MKIPTVILMAAVGFISIPSTAWPGAVSVRGFVDRDEVGVGDELVLSIEVTGAARARAPELGAIEGFAGSYLGPSTQISIVQGKVSSTVTHRYRLVARRPGHFRLGPFVVAVGGTRYRTAPIPVSVGEQRPGRAATRRGRGGREVSLELLLPAESAYLHERIPIQITLFAGGVQLEDIEFPVIAGNGFSVEKFGQPRRAGRAVNGKNYQTMTFETALVPQRSGRITVGPATMKMTLLVKRRNWDDFFGGLWRFDPFADRRPLELQSDPYQLEVVPLPEAGKPTDFSGAVGDFGLSLSAKPVEVRVGDPVTVTMRIAGQGNLAGATPPRIEAEGFKSYPVRAAKGKEGDGGADFEQVLIPRSEQVREVPPVSFSYFDPNGGKYVTVASAPVALTVLPARQAGRAAGPAEAEEREKGGPIGEDIVFIKDLPADLKAPGDKIYRKRSFWIFQGAPLLVLVATFLLVRRKERLLVDPRYARYLRAGREAKRQLREAARRVGCQDGAVFETVGQAVRDYLGDKLDLPPGAVEPDRVAECLGGQGAAAAARLRDLFALMESVRFGRMAAAEEQEQRALSLARAVVRSVERNRALRKRPAVRVSVLICLLAIGGLPGAGFGSTLGVAKAAFFAGNELYREGRYAEAERQYRRALGTGVESGALHFNLGNAYFKEGQLGRAIASYERARRLAPRDPDVEANLEFARSRLKTTEPLAPAPPLWRKLAFPLAFLASADELVFCASVAYVLLMVLLTARMLLPRLRLMLGRGCVVAALLLLLFGMSAGERIWQDEFRQRAVVIERKPVAVRFEPSETGTVHFQVTEGAVLFVERREPGWLRVKRADGMRGWIRQNAVERI